MSVTPAHSHTRVEAGCGIIEPVRGPTGTTPRHQTNWSRSPDGHCKARPRWPSAMRPVRVPDSTPPPREGTTARVTALGHEAVGLDGSSELVAQLPKAHGGDVRSPCLEIMEAAVAPTRPALLVATARVRAEQHPAGSEGCGEVPEDPGELAARHVEQRGVREDPVEAGGGQVEREEILVQHLARRLGARHRDKLARAVQPDRLVAECGEARGRGMERPGGQGPASGSPVSWSPPASPLPPAATPGSDIPAWRPPGRSAVPSSRRCRQEPTKDSLLSPNPWTSRRRFAPRVHFRPPRAPTPFTLSARLAWWTTYNFPCNTRPFCVTITSGIVANSRI